MRHISRYCLLAALAASSASCGKAVRSGASPVYLVIDSLEAAPGSNPEQFVSLLLSDVQTIVTSGGLCSIDNPCPTFYNDVGQATMRLSLKDIGSVASPNAPTSNNDVTITRYHVAYRRADGRNTPGVDVPYDFDGAATATIPASGAATLGFELVRNVAKKEAPLVQLIDNPALITVLAEVTFYGKDRVGNDVTASGSIQIDFGNFADKQ
jgi:hypothetical protein